MTDLRAAARHWAVTWQRGWEALDADPIVALYAEEARFSSQPFRPVDPGRGGVRRYVEAAFAEESDVVARFAEPIVDGRRAAVSWWAELVDSGEEVTLAGTSVLAFNDEGLVVEQWDTWNVDQRRRPPSDDAPFEPGGR